MMRTFAFDGVDDRFDNEVDVVVEINDSQYGFVLKLDGTPFQFSHRATENLRDAIASITED